MQPVISNKFFECNIIDTKTNNMEDVEPSLMIISPFKKSAKNLSVCQTI